MKDTVYTHDFADSSSWMFGSLGYGASAWVLDPPPGYAIKITGSEAKTSVNILIHSPLEIWFQCKRKTGRFGALPPHANDGISYCVTYDNMKDWIKRGGQLPSMADLTACHEMTAPLMMFSFNFEPAPVLWTSRGIGPGHIPKWNRMVIRIRDDQPYKTNTGSPVDLAVAKYMVEYFPDG